jgi:hypothetical protein
MIGPVYLANSDADVAAVAANAFLRLKGFSVGESAAAASTAEVIIRHGATAAGDPVVAPCNLAANGFGTFWYGEEGIPCPEGIFVERVSGETTIVLYVDRV